MTGALISPGSIKNDTNSEKKTLAMTSPTRFGM